MISDGVVIGVVLGLVFAAACYYLYSRIQQLERKVGLMENILLDLKVTTEQTLMAATEVPYSSGNTTNISGFQNSSDDEDDMKFVKSEEEVQPFRETGDERNIVVESNTSRGRNTPAQPVVVEREKPLVQVNYEAMTYKDLVQLAKQKGVTGTRNASKAHVIDLIRRHDAGHPPTADTVDETQQSVDLSGNKQSAPNVLNDLLSAQDLDSAQDVDSAEMQGTPLDGGDVDTSLVN